MRHKKSIIFSSLILLVSIYLFVSMTYAADSQESTTPSNATVSKNVAFSMSTNLSTGIQFGSVDMNTNNNNATGNYDGGPGEAGAEGIVNASYYITVDTSSNVNVDVCIKDDGHLDTQASDAITNGNYTWNDNSTSNSTEDETDSFAMSTDYVRLNVTNIGGGARTYIRLWLDVPNLQPAGVYNNTVYLKGVETGLTCG